MLKLINQESLDVNEINKVGHNIKYGWMGQNGGMEWFCLFCIFDMMMWIWWYEYDDASEVW